MQNVIKNYTNFNKKKKKNSFFGHPTDRLEIFISLSDILFHKHYIEKVVSQIILGV